jgi:UDP-N-acetylmuramoylalanine--D-glutamate ligase
LGIGGEPLRRAVRGFEALEHRFERLGPYRGISFYNAPLATVPEVTLAHLAALGPDVQTVLLGGHDRHLNFSELAGRLVGGGIRNLVLFPTSGARIWQAVRARSAAASQPAPHAFFVSSMEHAVRLAYAHTEPGKICLHSPASPSFGLFRDYRERGRLFKDWVRRLAGDGHGLETSGPMR